MSLNNFDFIGRLGRDPEVKTAASGKKYARISVGVDRPTKKGDQKVVDWFSVTAFDKDADYLERYAKKGKQIAVSGRVETNKTEAGVTYYNIAAKHVQLLGGPGEDKLGQAEQPFSATPAAHAPTGSVPYDEEIPF